MSDKNSQLQSESISIAIQNVINAAQAFANFAQILPGLQDQVPLPPTTPRASDLSPEDRGESGSGTPPSGSVAN